MGLRPVRSTNSGRGYSSLGPGRSGGRDRHLRLGATRLHEALESKRLRYYDVRPVEHGHDVALPPAFFAPNAVPRWTLHACNSTAARPPRQFVFCSTNPNGGEGVEAYFGAESASSSWVRAGFWSFISGF